MHIQTHILSGWCAANCFNTTPRQRMAAMIAAASCDIDGVSYLFGQKAYWTYHHTFGHNLFFGLLISTILAAWARSRIGTFLLCLGLVHLHLYMDYWGSGPDWHIHYLWPRWEPIWRNPQAWEFFSWQNLTVFFALLLWTIAIARFAGRTPLELVMPRLDRELVRLVWGHVTSDQS
jgi:inner membrane protein